MKPPRRWGKIIATAKLIAVEGRKLTFKVGACDDHGPIGNGTHERFIIDKAKFIAKLQSKRWIIFNKNSRNAEFLFTCLKL